MKQYGPFFGQTCTGLRVGEFKTDKKHSTGFVQELYVPTRFATPKQEDDGDDKLGGVDSRNDVESDGLVYKEVAGRGR